MRIVCITNFTLQGQRFELLISTSLRELDGFDKVCLQTALLSGIATLSWSSRVDGLLTLQLLELALVG